MIDDSPEPHDPRRDLILSVEAGLHRPFLGRMQHAADRHTVISMLIAEELLVLGHGPDGANLLSQSRNIAIGGSFLAQLAVSERLAVDDRKRLVVISDAATGDPLLDQALEMFVAQAGKKPQSVLDKIGKKLLDPLLQRLAQREILRPVPVRGLGITWATRWAPVTPELRQGVAAELGQVLMGTRAADARTGSLIAILDATTVLHKAVSTELVGGMRRRELRAAAKAVSEGSWASEATVRAIKDAAAATAAVMASAGVAAASS